MRALVLAILATLPFAALAQEAAPAARPEAKAEARPAPRPPTHPEPSLENNRPPADGAGMDAPAPPAGRNDPPAPDPVQGPKLDPAPPPIPEMLRESDFDHAACLLELTLLGADFDEIAPVADPADPDCGIARPILLRRPLPGIEIDGGARMRCDTARHLAHWLRDFVRPAASMLPGQPRLTALEPGSTYQCRATIGDRGEKMSEHAFGNAFDIAAFRFDDGTRVGIEPRQDSGDLFEAFQRAARASACLHFTTVLGPGANAAHDDHLHLDIKARKGGWRLCQ
ncbi:MAG: extensin family protein [Paracoccus sp. (in: a-proteobacteria)]